MKTDIQSIASTLKRTFEKNAWHGPAVKEVLETITNEQALSRVGNSHTVVELIAHMTAWRIFVVKKLEGDQDYKVTDEMNFPVTTDLQKAISDLEESQSKLLATLDRFPENKLHDIVPHNSYHYTYYTLLHGIIHHDLYHLGQIVLIKKAGLGAS
jgi:uncharacterized damage-inducible protein DinB